MTPTLKDLLKFDETHSHPASLSKVGLILLNPPERDWYSDESSANGLTFAHTGGDYVHFCLIEVAGKVTELSPVAMVVPSASECIIVGDTLLDFLALGSISGFFFLEQLVYDFDAAIEYLFDYDHFVNHCYRGGRTAR